MTLRSVGLVVTALLASCVAAAPFDPALLEDDEYGRSRSQGVLEGDGDADADADGDADGGGDADADADADGDADADALAEEICAPFCDRYVGCQPDESVFLCNVSCLCIVGRILRPDTIDPVRECLMTADCAEEDPIGLCAGLASSQIVPSASATDGNSQCNERDAALCPGELPCSVLLVVQDEAVDAALPCMAEATCGEVKECAENAFLSICAQ